MATIPTSDTFGALAAALARGQSKMRHPAATKTNPRFGNRYSTLVDVIDDGLSHLTAEGIAIVPWITAGDGYVTLTLRLSLADTDEWCMAGVSVPMGSGGPQDMGSALTYARRYLYLTLCGLATVDDDDDGERAARTVPTAVRRLEVDKVDEIRQAAAADGASIEDVRMWVDVATAGRTSELADVLYSELDALRAARKAWMDQAHAKTSSVRP